MSVSPFYLWETIVFVFGNWLAFHYSSFVYYGSPAVHAYSCFPSPFHVCIGVLINDVCVVMMGRQDFRYFVSH